MVLAPLLPTLLIANAVPCGINCSTRQYTSCNDSLDLSAGVTQNVSCSASLGSCAGETFCATLGHAIPASAYPIRVERLTLLAADDQPTTAAEAFQLQLYQESGSSAPGPAIGPRYDLSIAGSRSNVSEIDLNQGGFEPIEVTEAGGFRVCLTKQFDRGHNICLDADGTSAPKRNWAFVSIALDPNDPCGSQIGGASWYQADGSGSPIPGFPGIVGDFVLRATVSASQPAELPGADGCGGDRDAGMPDVVLLDSGRSDQGVRPDLGPEDTGVAPVDAGTSAGAPKIEGITPNRVTQSRRVDIVIVGSGFRAGLSATVGGLEVESIRIFGDSTLQGSLGALPSGDHDVVIINPDGQVALLPDAYRVAEEAAPVDDGCRCTAPGSRGAALLLLPIAFLWLGRGRRRLARRARTS